VVAVRFFVDFLKAKSFFEGDAAGLGVGDEAKVADEENLPFEECFFFDAIEFNFEYGRDAIAQVGCEGGSAYGGPVVKLYLVWLVRCAELAPALKNRDVINEGRICPGLGNALSLRSSDDVSGGFFDNTEAIELELAKNSGFA